MFFQSQSSSCSKHNGLKLHDPKKSDQGTSLFLSQGCALVHCTMCTSSQSCKFQSCQVHTLSKNYWREKPKILIQIAVNYQNHISKLFDMTCRNISACNFEKYLHNLAQLHSEQLVVRFWGREARWQLVKLPMAENWYRANYFLHPPTHHRDPTI